MLTKNYRTNIKYGYNGDATAGDAVWFSDGPYTGFPDVGGPCEIVSTSALDTSDGTGARTVIIEALDISGNSFSYTVTMNGTTPVSIPTDIIRSNRAHVLTAGSDGSNQGVITLRLVSDTAVVFFGMQPGINRTLVCAYTVPLTKKLYLVNTKCNMARQNGSNGGAEYAVRIRKPGEVFDTLRYETITNAQGDEGDYSNNPIKYPELTDIFFEIEYISDPSTRISGSFEFYLHNH